MRLVLLGPPGAGKGTHSQILSKDLGLPHVSTGDMLREAIRQGSSAGLKAKEFMDRGDLVPDQLVIDLVAERLKQEDAKVGFILDGFPRTSQQAEILDKKLESLKIRLDLVLYFKTSPVVIIRRLSGRRICGKCGKNYHLTNFKPKVEGICDTCGSGLIQRPDDREEAIGERLKVYQKQTAPLIEYYRKKWILEEVSGDLEVGPLNSILKELFNKRIPSAASR